MRLWPKKPLIEPRPDHRTAELLDRMDVFLVDIQSIADEIRQRLDEEEKEEGGGDGIGT